MKRALPIFVLILLALGRAGVAAGDEPPQSPLHVDLTLDLPLTIGGAIVALVPEVFKGELPGPACGLSCDPGRLNALDRTVVGNHLAGTAVASDALLGTGVALPVALDLIDALVSRGPGGAQMRGFGEDMLVLAEVLSMNFLANQVVKYAVRRPRPLVYDPTVEPGARLDPDANLSFYSEHSSVAFAMATSYSYLFTLRHPRSRLILPVWIGTHLLATSTAVLRVEAGKHFWTDVITGALAGSSIGLLCTYLHHRMGASGGGVAVRLLAQPVPGGAGLQLALTH